MGALKLESSVEGFVFGKEADQATDEKPTYTERLGTALAFMMAVTALSFPEFVILRRVLRLARAGRLFPNLPSRSTFHT